MYIDTTKNIKSSIGFVKIENGHIFIATELTPNRFIDIGQANLSARISTFVRLIIFTKDQIKKIMDAY